MEEIVIKTDVSNNRLLFVLDFIFSDILGVSYRFAKEEEAQNPHIIYSFKRDEKAESALWIKQHELISERGIRHVDINVVYKDTIPKFFTNTGDLHFDLFSACFFLLSRYEEYWPHEMDVYRRYKAENSIAFKNNFLNIPVIDYWIIELKTALKQRFKGLEFTESEFQFTPTIDVDSAYAYKHKGLVRNMGALIKDGFSLNFSSLKLRVLTLLGVNKDPFDHFDFLIELEKKHQLQSIYFVLLGDYGKYDKNIPYYNNDFQSLIKNLADHSQVLIHLSFASFYSDKKHKIEMERLQTIIHRQINGNRYHFLRFKMPDSAYRSLDAGINNDYTMGYATHLGFRAGTSRSFKFYDIQTEHCTELRFHPFCIMEATLRYYQHIAPEACVNHFKPIVQHVKKTNGRLISIFHSDFEANKQWYEIYTRFIEMVKEK